MKRFLTFSRTRGEEGFALASVMAVTAVLIILASAAVAYGVGSQHISRHDQDWNGALSAAEAGIDDYIFRLNENSNYWLYNAGNLPPDGNQAFTNWVNVAGGTTPAQYRYDINAGTITTNGVIKITSTGRVNETERTVYASLRRRSFIDYLYYTDYETKDPASYTGSPFTAAEAQTRCSKYYYGGSGVQRDVDNRVDYAGDSDASGAFCTDINFVSGDSINGPLHSNDAYLVCGTPAFNGETSSSWSGAAGVRYRTNGSCTNAPTFANAGDPRLLPPLTLPPSNSAIKAETLAGRGGCLFTGPTRIKLNNNGTMTVNSPFTKQTNNSPCTKNGTGALPSNGVIYVQNVPSVTTDPNYTSGCPYSVAGRTHPLGMPIASDIATYGCRNGDVFIEGTLDGQLTVAAENNIDITWNLTYKNGVGGDDLLGLVANNYVEVYHPVSCTSGNSSSCNLNANFPNETARNAKFQNPTIQAAILSVNHSFWVQNYGIGAASSLGTLHIDGAIAQRYRGPVGTTSGGNPNTGYVKQYVYDQRLKYLSPPKFLDPVASSWGVATWAENKVPAAYQ